MKNLTTNNVAIFNCDIADIAIVTLNYDSRYIGIVTVDGGAP